jgi:hypothetical protein
MLAKGWSPEVAVNGVEGKNQWRRVDFGVDPNHKEMMLDTDMCLAYRTNLDLAVCKKKFGACAGCSRLYGEGETVDMISTRGECCVWTDDRKLMFEGVFDEKKSNDFCGHKVSKDNGVKGERGQCCKHENRKISYGDCADIRSPRGVAFDDIVTYARSNDAFYHHFRKAWQIATGNGFNQLTEVVSGGSAIGEWEFPKSERILLDDQKAFVSDPENEFYKMQRERIAAFEAKKQAKEDKKKD